MKAIFQTKYGKSDVLQFGEQQTPKLKSDQVLISNHATSVNPRDWLIRSGRYQLQFLVPAFPLILGSDFAGEILEVGSKVKRFRVGDRVFGMKNPTEGLGTYADTLVAKEDSLAYIPDSLSYIEAAGVPLCGLTAWQALVHKAQVQAGDRVLVIGASGGVGCYAVQAAKSLGAEVTAVCSAANSEMVKRLGADAVIDYLSVDFLKEDTQYDIIFDAIGRHNLATCKHVMRNKGRFVSTIPSPGNLKSMIKTQLLAKLFRATQTASVVMVQSSGKDLAKLAALIGTQKIKPVIDSVFSIQDAAKAHDHSRSLRAKGKIVLQIQ